MNVHCTVIPGGAAGNHSVNNKAMNSDAVLVAVQRLDGTSFLPEGDLTSEFAIVPGAQNIIENAGGTATTNDWLLVVWIQPR
jgi:hypothetical protein